jgi:hypothetical protein
MLRLASLLVKLTALVVLVCILALAWVRGPDLWDRFAGRGAETPASAPDSAQAASVVRRYEQLARGDVGELILTAPELESVLLYELSDHLPASTSSPRIRIEGGEARLALETPPPAPPSLLRPLGRILPDSVTTEFTGVIVSTRDGEALFMVRRIEVGGIPLPMRLAFPILRSLGSGVFDEGAPEALRLELPAGVRAAYIEGDRLVLSGRT